MFIEYQRFIFSVSFFMQLQTDTTVDAQTNENKNIQIHSLAKERVVCRSHFAFQPIVKLKRIINKTCPKSLYVLWDFLVRSRALKIPKWNLKLSEVFARHYLSTERALDQSEYSARNFPFVHSIVAQVACWKRHILLCTKADMQCIFSSLVVK